MARIPVISKSYVLPTLLLVLALVMPWGCSSDSGGKGNGPLPDTTQKDSSSDGQADMGLDYCDSDEQCAPNFCDPELQRCVECYETEQCQEGYSCVQYRCQKGSGECMEDAQCEADGKVCDEEAGKCVECVKAKDCESGNYCTTNNKCMPWVCTAGSTWCEETTAKACKDDGSGLLWSEECDDGNPCTEGDGCQNGKCVEPAPKNCDDNNICTDDSCHPTAGCVHQFNSLPCEDGTTCTKGDMCSGGECISGPSDCDCLSDSDCVQHDDGDLCNGLLTCAGGTCIPKRNSSVTCPPSNDPCKKFVCKPETGLCVEVVGADGTECDDNDDCTLEDQCVGGICTGLAQTCDDNNECTMDACNPTKGCINTPVTGPCNDGDICTGPDACKEGVCFGPVLTCNDNEACTKDWCDPVDGCKHEVQTGGCDDGSACTENDTCVSGKCVGTAKQCADANICTDDTCDPSTGCKFTFNTKPCDDNNPCTVNDHCLSGECVPGGTLFNCNDNNPCTNDSCDIDTGKCVYIPNSQPCTDNDPCTQGDMCIDGSCVPGPEPDCNDDNFCTNDYCDTQGICRNLPTSGPCDDGNACTLNDTCIGGNCKGGSALNCNDNNPCTDDWCDMEDGCQHAFNEVPCNDMNMCTLNDMCNEGVCQGSTTVNCDDGKPCTQDDCSPMTGCSHYYITGPCEDGDLCTEGDYCAAGACVKGKLIDCDDENECTNDSCDPAKGCVYSNNSVGCEDGDACTMGDKCDGGVCKGGPVADCDDGNPCTDDECAFTLCLHTPNLKGCDDSDVCTINDKCASGYCIGTQLDNCGCRSLFIDGAAGYVRTSHSTKMDLGSSATVELYFKAESQTGDKALINRWGATGNQAFRIGVTPSSNTVKVDLKVQGSSTVQTITGTYTGSGWHHVAFVVDGAEARLYLDGSKKGSAALTAGIATSAVAMRMGARVNSSGTLEQYFKGYLDEIRISNTPRYSGTTFTPEPRFMMDSATVIYYRADQFQFNSLFDATENYLHGRVYDSYYYSADTVATKCAPLDNYPPSSPVVEIRPIGALGDQPIKCEMLSLSIDAEYDPVSYTYEWFLDGELQPLYTGDSIPAEAVKPCPRWDCDGCQEWTCRVTPSDGKPGLPGENTQVVGINKCLDCEGTVYNDHCYYAFNDEVDWGTARSSCGSWGGWLVVISDAGEQAAVASVISENAWIGLTDQEAEGNFVWVTGEAVTYTNWATGQPNDIGTQDCVMAFKDSGYKWNDMSCPNDHTPSSNNAKQYVCEKAYPWPIE